MHHNGKYHKMMLLTIYIKCHSGLSSISHSILGHTLVLAIVLRSLYNVDGVLTVAGCFDETVIQIEPVL